MTKYKNFAELFYRPIKILTVCRTSNPDFGLFEVSDYKLGDGTCVVFSDNPKARFFQTLIINFYERECYALILRKA